MSEKVTLNEPHKKPLALSQASLVFTCLQYKSFEKSVGK